MHDWTVLISDGLDKSGQALLRAAAQVDERPGITPAELLEIVSDCDALIVRSRTRVTAEVLSASPRLKVVGRAGVGVDNIDLEAAAASGVIVVNSPQATTLAVAEHALGLMLALARSIPRADAAMKAGQWIKKELEGIELSGKTLGIVGVGNIGAAVALRAAALGMAVIGYDPLLPNEAIQQRGAEPATLPELYTRADFITLHLPLTAETAGLLDRQAFESMKPGVRLVCTARGGLIDEEALLTALEAGKVAGAALDVFAQEPPGATRLVAHPQVIATPHVAAQTIEAQKRAAVDIAHEVLAALRGEPLRWRVT
jgi:D-3-phosphoglycerate dehydrogenase / 2-oxoglutarate reductase